MPRPAKKLTRGFLEREMNRSIALVDQHAADNQTHAAPVEYGVYLTLKKFAECDGVRFPSGPNLYGYRVTADEFERCSPWLQRYYVRRRRRGVSALGTITDEQLAVSA